MNRQELSKVRVYVTSYLRPTAKWQVPPGRAPPAWSADGRQLYYRQATAWSRPRSRQRVVLRSAARPVEALGDRIVDFNASASGGSWPCARSTPEPPLTLSGTGSSSLARSKTVSDAAAWPQGKLASAIAARGAGRASLLLQRRDAGFGDRASCCEVTPLTPIAPTV